MDWPIVEQSRPTIIRANSRPPKNPAKRDGWKTAVVFPDTQIGFRKSNGVMIPTHDPVAMNVALKVQEVVQHDTGVDVVVNLGDFLDLPEQGRFAQEPEFARTTQMSLDFGHEFLSRQVCISPKAEHHLLEGNHDFRLEKYITANAAHAQGIRPANLPDSFPVMSVPYLLRLEDLNVHFAAGYPSAAVWLNDHIRCIHGYKHRSSGSTADAVTKNERVSTIFGHVHRIEVQYRTQRDRHGPYRLFAATPGCLCDVTGSVPSYHSSTDRSGSVVTQYEDWQQGVLVVHYREDSNAHHLEMVPIQDGWAMFRGQIIS